MSAPHENNPVNQEVAARQEAANRKSGEELAKEIIRLNIKIQELKDDIEKSVKKEGKGPDTLGGSKDDKDSPKGKANSIKESVQEILLAAKAGKVVFSETQAATSQSDFAQSTIKQIAQQIDAGDVTEQSAPYLGGLLSKIADGTIKDIQGLKTEFNNLKDLKSVSRPLYERVQNALVKTAQEKGGIGEQEAKQKFDVESVVTSDEKKTDDTKTEKKENDKAKEDEIKQVEIRNRMMENERQWWSQFGDYFSEATDKELVRACYDTKDFKEYILKQKKAIAEKEGKDIDSEEVGKIVSLNFEKEVVGLFGQLYNRLDHEKAGEFFEQIEQQDVMRGILPIKNLLKRRLQVIALELHNNGHDDLGLFRRVEDRSEVMDIPIKVGDKIHYKPRMRIHPYPSQKRTTGSEFLHFLDITVDNYLSTREYTHNARAIFEHPVDPEKGFYAPLKQFAEKMNTPDFDAMYLLPDADIFQTALQLYDKHVDELFATTDWRHSAVAFQAKSGEVRNQPEKDVLEQLRIMFPDISDPRLQAATTMAVGAARGIFLTEQEKGAFADPHLDETGKFTYGSYYTNDNSALIPFNPMHHFYRYQGVRTIDPILFAPVENMDKNKSLFSDHNDLWKKMQGYKDSFLNGRGGPGSAIADGEQLFADFVVNFGRVGGPMERKGWRTNLMLENLCYYDTVGEKEGKLTMKVMNHPKSFMRLENIGYEAFQHFISIMDPKFSGVSSRRGLSEEQKRFLIQKKALFNHVYEKYFRKDPSTLDSFVRQIRSEKEKEVWKEIKSGKQAPVVTSSIEEEIETRTTQEFMNRALARLVAQRMPSKILRIDRDRFSKDGESRWRKIAKEMFPTKDVGDKTTRDFDKVMRDLIFAEQMLRTKVSEKMRDLKSLPEDQHWKWGEIDYNLTQEKIRQLFQGKQGYDEERINQMCKLLGLIEKHYTQGADGEKYLDKELIKIVKEGGVDKKDNYRFTFGLEELAMEFIPWRAAGNKMLARAVGDISTVEQTMAKEIIKLPALLHQMAIDGKGDFTPVLDMLQKMYGSMEGIIGPPHAHKVVHHVAALAIQYFKKDTRARWFYGLFGQGRKNSLAAERAGSGVRVWEWDSTTIDRFIIGLESRGLLPPTPYSPTNSKPEYVPRYINIPFVNKPIKLPEKMNLFGKDITLFRQRKNDWEYTSKTLRDQFGGNWKDITFDMINKYLPFILVWLFWQYIKKAQDEAEGKKK